MLKGRTFPENTISITQKRNPINDMPKVQQKFNKRLTSKKQKEEDEDELSIAEQISIELNKKFNKKDK